MCSKKKLNGAGTIRSIELAAQRCGCSLHDFVATGVANSNSPKEELQKFQTFRTHGAAAIPNYQIPPSLLRLVEEAHQSPNPRTFIKKSSFTR